jgi:hypothetical protein
LCNIEKRLEGGESEGVGEGRLKEETLEGGGIGGLSKEGRGREGSRKVIL